MDLELWQLDRKYARLRSPEPQRCALLLASISEQGQQAPVLVVAGDREHHFVLIDGYRRVAALERLGRDTVTTQLLSGSEADCLVWSHNLRHGRRSNALEEAWLLQVLEEEHGLGREELALRFGRSASWVCRRLALVRELPASVHDAVKSGTMCAHAAMKYLVPLARANAEQCSDLVTALGNHRATERQIAALYAAWRAGTAEQRSRIVEQPLLYLRIEDRKAGEPVSDEDPGAAHDRRLLDDLSRLAGMCRSLRRSMAERRRTDRDLPWPAVLRHGWMEAQASFHALLETVTEETADARS